MTHEKMTVHKALAELKIIDDRINKAINDCEFITTKKHGATNIKGISTQQTTENIKSAYNKIESLINRRNALKRAVVKSNATVKVTIANKEYTVAEAIDMKNHGLEGYTILRNRLAYQLKNCTATADRENEVLEKTRADAYIKDMYGSSDMSKVGEDAKKARKEFIESQTIELVDPIDAKKKIEELDDMINSFNVEVDSALSVSNAITEIEIEY